MKKRFLYLLLLILISISSQSQNALFIVFLNSNPDRANIPEEEVSALQQGHLDNIGRLYDEGKLLLAGPFNKGGGIFVLKAESLKAAKALLSTDPAISANRFLIDIHPMTITAGWICEQDEPYEMIMLDFIHFKLTDNQNETFSISDCSNKYEILFAFSFFDQNNLSNDHVIILNDSIATNKITNESPLLKEGINELSHKKWWTTNKTFCKEISSKIN